MRLGSKGAAFDSVGVNLVSFRKLPAFGISLDSRMQFF